MFTYTQLTGEFSGNSLSAFGYSGFEEGKNNPSLENEPRIGPIPRGEWIISGPPFDSPTHGPFVLRLIPKEETELFGRSGFLIHGDSIKHPGEASLGCIILPRVVREKIWESRDINLKVV